MASPADGEINTKFQTRQEKKMVDYEKTPKHLSLIHPDDPVRVLNPHSRKCEPGIVKYHTETPR